MSETDFEKLITAINKELFTQNKLAILEIAAKENYFETSQVSLILKQFFTDSNKISALNILLHKILDKQNLYLLLDEFTFSSSKEEVKELLINH